MSLLARLLALCVLLASMPSLAADSDLQQYTRASIDVEAVCGANPLSSSLLLVRDGKLITADNNGAFKAPINRSVKQIADYMTCVRCMVSGACAGVNLRTLKSLQIDGVGGNVATASAGTIVPSAARGSTTLPGTANPHGVLTQDSAVFGYCSVSYSPGYAFTGGFNCDGISNTVPGTVVVNFASAPANYLKCVAIGNGFFNSGAAFVSEAIAGAPVAGKMPVTVYIKNMAGIATDAGFSVLVFCGA